MFFIVLLLSPLPFSLSTLLFRSYLRFYFILVALVSLYSWLPRYGRVQQKVTHSFVCRVLFFQITFCFITIINVLGKQTKKKNVGTNQKRLCYLLKGKMCTYRYTNISTQTSTHSNYENSQHMKSCSLYMQQQQSSNKTWSGFENSKLFISKLSTS